MWSVSKERRKKERSKIERRCGMMATCKDCIHHEVCAEEGIYFTEKYIKGATVSNDVKSLCHWFKNKLDYAKVKHGEWEKTDNGVCFCSICNHGEKWKSRGNYCPNCGAKMDGRS